MKAKLMPPKKPGSSAKGHGPAAKPTKPAHPAKAPAPVAAAKPAPAPAPKAAAPAGKAATPAPKAATSAGKAAGGKRGGTKLPKTMLSPMFGNRGVAAPVAGALAGAHDEVCREVACEGLATSGGYCRLHYIKNWKKIKLKEVILKEGKLQHYIEELVAKYPDKYIEAICGDLSQEKEFAKVIHDLDLDESVDEFEGDSESMEGVIDSIKREFEDEGGGGGAGDF